MTKTLRMKVKTGKRTVMVSRVLEYVQIHQIVHIKYVNFFNNN